MVVKATLADHFMLLVFFVSEKSINIDHAYLLRNKTIDQSREKKNRKTSVRWVVDGSACIVARKPG